MPLLAWDTEPGGPYILPMEPLLLFPNCLGMKEITGPRILGKIHWRCARRIIGLRFVATIEMPTMFVIGSSIAP